MSQTFDLAVEGMHCGGCVRRVKAALAEVPGVTVDEVVVGRVRGELDGAERAQVVAAIEGLGFKAVGGDGEAAAGGASST